MDEIVRAARAFAERVHADHQRENAARAPYITHLDEVADFTARHGGSPQTIAAAWLHDTVEDCEDVSEALIAEQFGPAVATLVMELTDDTSLRRAARKRAQIDRGPGQSPEACLIKLGDKWSNCRAVGATPPVDWGRDRRLAYLDWSERVAAALAHRPAAALAEFEAAVAAARADIDG
jgi:(p)ppGpp synthase/HD superfamily hydrolase